jgi:Plasmid encoded RepA protein
LQERSCMLESVGELLARTHGDLLISKQKQRQAEGIAMVRQRRDDGSQTLGYTTRPFILCGLPIRRPPRDQLIYERRNGSFILQVTGHPEFGLPFGQDRLVPIFLATMAVKQQSPTIRFRSASILLDWFGLSKGGKEYRRLVGAFERIFGATIFFGTDALRPTARVLHRARFSFLREARIWYNRDGGATESLDNVVVLSDEFYAEALAHPIPADLEAVRVLASAPAVLDLFLWLTYRCFVARGEEIIPLFGAWGLTHQLGSVEYSRPRRFRAMLDQWLATIRALWPACPAKISTDGLSIAITKANSIASKLGTSPLGR